MSASSLVQTAAGGVLVITHVIPAPQNSPEKKDLGRLQLAALGTVQLLIGLVVFLFGFIEVLCPGLGVISGVFVWGAIIFIISGSVTVTASKSSSRSVVFAARGISVAAVLASSISTIIYILNAVGFYVNHNSCHSTHQYALITGGSSALNPFLQGQILSGLLALFSIVEFIVSMVVIGISCDVSALPTDQLIFTNNQSHEATAQTSEPTPTYETLNEETAPSLSVSQHEMTKHPEYNTTIINA